MSFVLSDVAALPDNLVLFRRLTRPLSLNVCREMQITICCGVQHPVAACVTLELKKHVVSTVYDSVYKKNTNVKK